MEESRMRIVDILLLSGNSVDEAGGSDVSWLTGLGFSLDTGLESKELRQP